MDSKDLATKIRQYIMDCDHFVPDSLAAEAADHIELLSAREQRLREALEKFAKLPTFNTSALAAHIAAEARAALTDTPLVGDGKLSWREFVEAALECLEDNDVNAAISTLKTSLRDAAPRNNNAAAPNQSGGVAPVVPEPARADIDKWIDRAACYLPENQMLNLALLAWHAGYDAAPKAGAPAPELSERQASGQTDTQCWRCNATYPMASAKCPKCQASNANVDYDAARREIAIDQARNATDRE